MKILITDTISRKAFDLVNILLRKFTNDSIIYTYDINKFVNKLIYRPVHLYLLRNTRFSEDLNYISKTFSDDEIIYFPIEEQTTLLFYKYIENNPKTNFRFLLPSMDSYKISRDKERLNIYCKSNNVPAPYYYSENDIRKKNFKYPIILKPKIGSGSEGIKYIFSNSELTINKIDFKEYFIQELLKNPKSVSAGFFLCKNGQVISFYSHQRIRTYPSSGGVSVFSKSVNDRKVRLAGEKIVKKLKWSGFIMIEFLYCPRNKTFKVIEINPRLWGSYLLSEFCNSNFTFGYIDLCLNKNTKFSKVVSEKYIRWIFPYDLIYFFKNPQDPVEFFKKTSDTCYINFTYSNYSKSIKYILLTYFNITKIKKKLFDVQNNSLRF